MNVQRTLHNANRIAQIRLVRLHAAVIRDMFLLWMGEIVKVATEWATMFAFIILFYYGFYIIIIGVAADRRLPIANSREICW